MRFGRGLMNRYGKVLLGIVLSSSMFACDAERANEARNAAIANKVEKAIASAPSKSLLVGLESKAFEAWKNKDTSFWDGHLDARFVSFTDGKRLDKAGEIKLLSELKCELLSHRLYNEKMTPAGVDAIVLTATATVEGACERKKLPSPIVFSTLYVRSGDSWKAAYHNEVPLLDQKADKPKTLAQQQSARSTTSAAASDPLTGSLLAIEQKARDSWRKRDTASLDAYAAEDISVVDASGKVAAGKKAVIAAWTEPKCNIKAASAGDATGSEIAANISILTYKGTATGVCDGQPLRDTWVTTIFLKEGDEWKALHIFQTPVS